MFGVRSLSIGLWEAIYYTDFVSSPLKWHLQVVKSSAVSAMYPWQDLSFEEELMFWLVMDSSVRRCQGAPFMNKRTLLKNHCLFLWNEGGRLVLLRASLSQCQVLRFKQTIPIASVSHSGSRHFSKARWKKCANLLRNSVWSSPTELYFPLLIFFYSPATVCPLEH